MMKEWMEEWPWTKTLLAVGIAFFIATGFVIAGIAIWGIVHDVKPDASYVNALDTWLENVVWFCGAGIAGLIGKRATTKASVIEAQTEQTTQLLDRTATTATTLAPRDTLGEVGAGE